MAFGERLRYRASSVTPRCTLHVACCSVCPNDKVAMFASAFVPFAAFLLGVFALMILVVWQLERMRGMAEPFETAIRQSKEFCIWTCLSAQILATASNSTSPGVPEWVSSVYKIVAFFNLDTQGVVPRECMASAFLMPWLTLGSTCALLLFQGIIFAMFKRKVRIPARLGCWRL